MSLLMDPDLVGETIGITAMGNEGGQWIGMAPFVETDHIVSNFGDGTYFHSGQLALQAAIGSGVSITFKILYNDTVAMTGGQDASHRVAVPELVTILLAHGVAEVMITTDDLEHYDHKRLPGGVEVWDRTRMLEAQERLAKVAGVTVLIHDQECAAELRRARKRGRAATPTTRVMINHRICEGCGDCGDVSNCLSVEPIDTPFGRKTTIDQASCNLDYSCLEGDCPSFMTIEMPDQARPDILSPPPVPDPVVADPATVVTARLAGIGGTGVVTVAQILATAAMFDGWDVRGLDQTGLSQKAGPVISDLTLARSGAASSNLIGRGEATVILAFDQLVAAADNALEAGAVGRTRIVGSTHTSPTGRMISRPEIPFPTATEIETRLTARSIGEDSLWVDSVDLTRRLVGDAAPANVFLLGVAIQAGFIPVEPASIEQAIELNGVAVDANRAAFGWGRRWADEPTATEAVADAAAPAPASSIVTVPKLPRALARRVSDLEATVGSVVEMLTADLIAYQNRAYAGRYLDLVERVHRHEVGLSADPSTALTTAVAHNLHKLMAYKDEYEVARLMLLPEARAEADAVAGRRTKVTWRLHPPVLRALGMKRKLRLGPWAAPAIRALRAGKRLRGTRIDPFGRTRMRRLERDLRDEYVRAIEDLLDGLTARTHGHAVEIAGLPDMVRGYEALKERRAADYREQLAAALAGYGSTTR
jgi:indolepyruvate ferredoxin oxidoreductase